MAGLKKPLVTAFLGKAQDLGMEIKSEKAITLHTAHAIGRRTGGNDFYASVTLGNYEDVGPTLGATTTLGDVGDLPDITNPTEAEVLSYLLWAFGVRAAAAILGVT